MKPVCRWGILSTAGIGRRHWGAIHQAPNATLAAVASRDRARAETFIAARQQECPHDPAPQALGSYQELIEAPDIQALYIPLPTGLRTEWIIKAAEAGKHVLAEKPAAVSTPELVRIRAACEANRVQFMDGVMFMHSRRLQLLDSLIHEQAALGDLRRITAQFTFRPDEAFYRDNIRMHSELEPLGCLGDLGWYGIRFALWAMRWALPETVTGYLHATGGSQQSPRPVPLEFSGELRYAGGVSAAFHCSFLTHDRPWAMLSGSAGCLHLPTFVHPDAARLEEFFFERRGQKADAGALALDLEGTPSYAAQECRMVQTFSELALSNQPDPHWMDIAMRTQHISDACLASATLGRPQPIAPLP